MATLQLNTTLENIQEVEDTIKKLSNEKNIIKGNVSVVEMVLESDSQFNLTIDYMNNIDVEDLLNSVINIENDNELNASLKIENVEVEVFETKMINERNATELLHTFDDIILNELVINGDVFVENFSVGGKVNGVKMDKTNILLMSGDQILSSDMCVENVAVERIYTERINGARLQELEENYNMTNLEAFLDLSVRNLTVGGLINDVDVQTLDKHALKLSGNQTVEGDYIFEVLVVENVTCEKMSGKTIPDDFVTIKNGDHEIKSHVHFHENLTINHLIVENRLNDIGVSDDGKLDVLLSDSQETQHITGRKVFNNVTLLSPINVNGPINSTDFDEVKPVVTVDEDVVLRGDFIITGEVTIENLLECTDMLGNDDGKSVNYIKEHGLRLSEEEIDCEIDFVQALNVSLFYNTKHIFIT